MSTVHASPAKSARDRTAVVVTAPPERKRTSHRAPTSTTSRKSARVLAVTVPTPTQPSVPAGRTATSASQAYGFTIVSRSTWCTDEATTDRATAAASTTAATRPTATRSLVRVVGPGGLATRTGISTSLPARHRARHGASELKPGREEGRESAPEGRAGGGGPARSASRAPA